MDICSVKEGGIKNSKANLEKVSPNDAKNAQNNGNAAEKTRDSAEMNADIGFLITDKKRKLSRK